MAKEWVKSRQGVLLLRFVSPNCVGIGVLRHVGELVQAVAEAGPEE